MQTRTVNIDDGNWGSLVPVTVTGSDRRFSTGPRFALLGAVVLPSVEQKKLVASNRVCGRVVRVCRAMTLDILDGGVSPTTAKLPAVQKVPFPFKDRPSNDDPERLIFFQMRGSRRSHLGVFGHEPFPCRCVVNRLHSVIPNLWRNFRSLCKGIKLD